MSIVDETLIAEVRGWANSNVVYLTLADRNVKNLSLDEAKIDALDKQWRAERKTSDPPLITAVLSSPLSG